MSEKRRDNRGRILHNGESQRQDDRSSGIISPKHNENVYVVLAEFHEDGSMYTIDEYLNNKDCPGVPILHYEDYCVLFDK